MRDCVNDGKFYSCHPRAVGEIASYLYAEDFKDVAIGTGCFCKDNICNAHSWNNLIETKGEKVIERKISPTSMPTYATETDAKTDATKTDAKKTQKTDAKKSGAKKTDAKKTDTIKTEPTNAMIIAASIPEDPRREHIHKATENTPNIACFLQTENQLYTILIIMIHFIISLMTQY